MTKPWYASKTLWFNAVVAMLVALESVFNVLEPYLPTNVYALGVGVLAVGNAFLRVITTQGLQLAQPNTQEGELPYPQGGMSNLANGDIAESRLPYPQGGMSNLANGDIAESRLP